MFTAFDENMFWKAIEEKEYLRLKVNAVSAMRRDPTFSRGEAENVLRILQERVPEIFEEEVCLEYEERLDKAEWDKRYFTKLTYWFQENFALSRVAYIKEVGKVVHADTEVAYNESMRLYAVSETPAQNTVPKKTAAAPARTKPPAQKPVTKEPVRGTVTNPPKAPEKSKKQTPKMFRVVAMIAAVCSLVLGIALLLKILLV